MSCDGTQKGLKRCLKYNHRRIRRIILSDWQACHFNSRTKSLALGSRNAAFSILVMSTLYIWYMYTRYFGLGVKGYPPKLRSRNTGGCQDNRHVIPFGIWECGCAPCALKASPPGATSSCCSPEFIAVYVFYYYIVLLMPTQLLLTAFRFLLLLLPSSFSLSGCRRRD
jgi:hypothetical protein